MDEQHETVARSALAETGVVETTPTAWSDADVEEPGPYDDARQRNWLITGVIFAVTAAVAGLAGLGAYVFLRQPKSPAVPVVTSTITATPITLPTTTVRIAPPPVTVAPTTTYAPNPGELTPMQKYDQQFIVKMDADARAEGSSITNVDVLIYRAHQTCTKLRAGYIDSDLAQQLIDEFQVSPTIANALVHNAMTSYPNCP